MKQIVKIAALAGIVTLLASQADAITLKDITFTTKDAGTVVFSHSKHLEQKSRRGIPAFSCATCHTGGKSKRHYTMVEMYRGQSCGACHNGKQAFDAHDCSRCHQVKEIVYQVQATGPTPFSHQKHLAHLKDCSVCHTKLYKTGKNPITTMAQMEKGASCGFCHNGKKLFGVNQCSRCHRSPELTYQTAPVAQAVFSHTFHTQMYTCTSCHPGIVKPNMKLNKRASMSAMEHGKSCGACHDGKTAFSVKSDCAKCHIGLKPPGELTFRSRNGSIIGHFSHTFHTAIYPCNECHTRRYPYRAGSQAVTMKEMAQGASCGSCHNGKIAFPVTGDCLKCHKK